VKDEKRVWLRFEGPGKLHNRRWHIARAFPADSWGTLCGLIVREAEIADEPGEGPQCVSCVAFANRQTGHL
jgi:hypothetical protein